MLIADCGGNFNLLISVAWFGLAQSEQAVARSYSDAALDHLTQGQLSCSLNREKDLGGRIFEIFYSCNMQN